MRPAFGRRSRRSALASVLRNSCCFLIFFAVTALGLYSFLKPDGISDFTFEWPGGKEKRLEQLTFELNRTIALLQTSLEDKQADVTKLREASQLEHVQRSAMEQTLGDTKGLLERAQERVDKSAQALTKCGIEKAEILRQLDSREQLTTTTEVAEAGPVHLSSTCGRWQEKYRLRHKELRAASKQHGQQKFLTYRCDWSGEGSARPCGSLGEILLGIMSSMVMSLVTDRALIIHWEGAERFFQIGEVDWRYTDDIRIQPSKPASREDLKIPDPPDFEPIQAGDIVTLNLTDVEEQSPSLLYYTFAKLEGASNIIVTWNRGVTVPLTDSTEISWGETLRSLGLRSPFVFGCLLKYLLRPRKEPTLVQQYPRPAGGDGLSVCLYLQQPDYLDATASVEMAIDDQHVKELFLCMNKLADFWAPPYAEIQYRVLGGPEALLRKAKEQFPHIEIRTKGDHAESDGGTREFETELEDWILFSRCNLFVFHDSSFAKTAAMYSLQPMSSWVLPKVDGGEEFAEFCAAEEPTGVLKMAELGMGI